MLKVSEIEVRYSGVPVIHDVSLEVNRGELVSVVGANGAGKSTLILTMLGFHKPAAGSIRTHTKGTPSAPLAGMHYSAGTRTV